MAPDKVVLKLAVLVLCRGLEPAHHADVAGLGEDPLLGHFQVDSGLF